MEWMADAACKGHPSAWWFPEPGDNAAQAKLICSTCPVRDACFEYATATHVRDGVWAGRSFGRPNNRSRQPRSSRLEQIGAAHLRAVARRREAS